MEPKVRKRAIPNGSHTVADICLLMAELCIEGNESGISCRLGGLILYFSQ